MFSRLYLTSLIWLTAFIGFSQHTEKIPKKTRNSISLMTAHITRSCTTERQKVDSIYHWITHNIEYDYKQLEETKPLSFEGSKKILKSKKAICNGYVELMKDMLDVAEIESQFIEGYIRSFEPDYEYIIVAAEHAWIAIKVDGKWELADPTWDAGYIGRIPRKEKEYPKRWDKQRTFKTTTKQEKWEKKIEKKKVAFDQREAEKDPFTNEIGFVSDPGQDYYKIHSDSFLLTHLPTLPEWQLRNETLSIEQFCKRKDSVRLELSNPMGSSIDYESKIRGFNALTIVERWLYTSENGFDYNPWNHGVKAIHNYNTLSVHMDSKVKRELSKYPDFSTRPIWADLLPKADTAIIHAKLALKEGRAADKEKEAFYKKCFKREATDQKSIEKEIRQLELKMDKFQEACKSSNEQIKTDDAFISEQLAKYQLSHDRQQSRGSSDETNEKVLAMFHYVDSLNEHINRLHDQLDNQRKNSAQQRFLDLIADAAYTTEYSSAYVSMNNIATADEVAKYDSLTLQSIRGAITKLEDSVQTELLSKEIITEIKNLERYIKSQKTTLRELGENKELSSAPEIIQRELEAICYAQAAAQHQEHLNSLAYNELALKNLNVIKTVAKKLQQNVENLSDTREKRSEFLFERSEISLERDKKLFEQIQDDCKQWKKDLKKRAS